MVGMVAGVRKGEAEVPRDGIAVGAAIDAAFIEVMAPCTSATEEAPPLARGLVIFGGSAGTEARPQCGAVNAGTTFGASGVNDAALGWARGV